MKPLKVKLFADGAEKAGMLEMYKNPLISGFTTNPTLMRKVGITDYRAFALDILAHIKDRPISFEVFSDEFPEMERQALDIASWGSNVNVKIPITNTKAQSCASLVENLSKAGVKLNVTAIMTIDQVKGVLPALAKGPGGYVSVFAGRIADAGIDPLPIMVEVVNILKAYPHIELIWASPRELYNIVQANTIGCHIITATNDILKKLPTIGKDLTEFSLDTVKMFYNDATAAGFTL
jgi:transaldolase